MAHWCCSVRTVLVYVREDARFRPIARYCRKCGRIYIGVDTFQMNKELTERIKREMIPVKVSQ